MPSIEKIKWSLVTLAIYEPEWFKDEIKEIFECIFEKHTFEKCVRYVSISKTLCQRPLRQRPLRQRPLRQRPLRQGLYARAGLGPES